MRNRVKSVHAMEDGKARLATIKELLEGMTIQLQKYESLRDWDYGYVGDLGHIEEVLGECYEFMVSAD